MCAPASGMNGAGEWEKDIAPGRSAVCWPGEGGPPHQLTVNGAGEVTGVRIVMERTGEEVLFGSTTQQSLAAAAFAAAQPGWNGVFLVEQRCASGRRKPAL